MHIYNQWHIHNFVWVGGGDQLLKKLQKQLNI